MQVWEPFVEYDKIEFTAAKRRPNERGKHRYAAELCAFDIETTRLVDVEQSFMYVWQFSLDNRMVIMGRTWGQFLHMLQELKRRAGSLRVLVYVHNLSFEGQFLAGIYPFRNDEVFAIESRRLLRLEMYGTFDFRCAYKLFNLSLEAVTKKYNCQYRKRSGADFDYSIVRTPATPLTHKELLYCVYDVMGLVEAVRAQMAANDDSVYSQPYTQTGYVRRQAKREMRPERYKIYYQFPDFECFKILRAAFRGGNTHANRYYVGEILPHVHGNDVSSEYPTQQVLEQYPRSPFQKVGALSLGPRFLRSMIDRGQAVLLVAGFVNIRLRDKYNGFPYISYAKCLDKHFSGQLDNGRVLHARHIRLALTDIDFTIIERSYTWDRLEVEHMYLANYGPMYDGIRELNKRLFIAKTRLKGDPAQKIYYDRAKEQLNAIYGMTCQSPLQRPILFNGLAYDVDDSQTDAELYDAQRRKAFVTYQLAVWTTANARAELQKFIDRAGDSAIYCDTDSLMYTGDVNFDDYNADYRRRCIEAGEGAYADDAGGARHYMGVFESEDVPSAGCKYDEFITLGAKRYAYVKPGGELGITVAGVSKKQGAAELQRRGGMRAFREGFVFEDSGKLEAVYNDRPHGRVTVDGCEVDITSNVSLRPTTYTLGFSKDYAALIKSIRQKDLQEFINDRNSLMQI